MLTGKTAVVTGGAKGIGRAIAAALGARGANVVLTSRSVESAESAAFATGPGVMGCACDLRDAQSVDQLFTEVKDRFGGIDILVNNAGLAGPNSALEKLPIDVWNEIIETNLTGTFLVTRAALPLIRRGGSVIFNLSIITRTVFPGMGAYAASKHGLLGLADTLREELRPRAIRVISLLPGATDTEIWQQFWPEAPRGKMISPEAVAEVAVAAILLPEEATVNELVIAPTAGNL